MRRRLFIIGVRADLPSIYAKNILDLDTYKKRLTLSQFLNRSFEKNFAYTIRCGGRNSPILDKHNWDGYFIDGKEYRLTIEDCLKLQGFDANFQIYGTKKEQWTLVGNTIPTVLTKILGLKIFFPTS